MVKICSRCKVRRAMVFVTRVEGDKTYNEGLCLKCAKELGIKPVEDMINQMGISEEDLEAGLDDALTELMPMDDAMDGNEADSDDGSGRAPSLDLGKLFERLNLAPRKSNDESNDAEQSGKGQAKADEKKKKSKTRKNLDQFCIDLTAKARRGLIDNIIGRDRELERMMQILCRRQKNNPCLIGEPGVGKTAIAEALAIKISKGEVPYKLKDKEVLLLDMTALVAGTQFRGQFENRIKGLLEEAKTLGNIILMIDEVHSIVGAGDAEGAMNAANILKPALSRGEIQIIGATTLVEYRKHIEKDTALERRFQPIMVSEPSIEDSVKILLGIKEYYERYHSVVIPDYLIRVMVNMSERYITDRYLPDKAIDLMDEAASSLSMNSQALNRERALRRELEEITEQQELLAASEPNEEYYRSVADLKTREIQCNEELQQVSVEASKLVMSENDLAKVIEIWTGIPASNITENEFVKIDKMEEKLKDRIVGQDEAISKVARAIKRSRAGISYKKKPCSFIFAGSTGVGKTELVKVLANYLFDSPEALIRLDMSEFMEKHSVSRIIGSPPGYVGYDDAGQLTEKIRRKPYSVVLFDEIEKAHPDVLNILLQILDDGKITDSHGKLINFESAVIIMTTNAGSKVASAVAGFNNDADEVDRNRVLKALEGFLRPEFINRVDEIVVFNKLSEENFKSIAAIMLNDMKEVLAVKGITLYWDDTVVEFLVRKGYSEKFGARNLRRLIQTEIEDTIAADMISNYKTPVSGISISAADNKITIKCI